MWKDCKSQKKFIFQNFYVSAILISIFINGKCDIKKYTSIGSLEASLARDYIKSRGILSKSEKFDICLVSEFQPDLDGDWSHIKDFQDKLGQSRICTD